MTAIRSAAPRWLLSLALAFGTLVVTTHAHQAQAAKLVAVDTDRRGVAIDGYDPVAYFTLGRPVKGSKDYTATHQGATYRFSSAEHRDAFTADPQAYLPAFGGYCAYGVALGKKFSIDPEAWKIVDGKLYLNKNKSIQKEWLKDVPGHISKADAQWPQIKEVPAGEL